MLLPFLFFPEELLNKKMIMNKVVKATVDGLIRKMLLSNRFRKKYWKWQYNNDDHRLDFKQCKVWVKPKTKLTINPAMHSWKKIVVKIICLSVSHSFLFFCHSIESGLALSIPLRSHIVNMETRVRGKEEGGGGEKLCSYKQGTKVVKQVKTWMK